MATKDRTSLKNDFANGKYATGEKFADLIDSMKVVQLPVVDPQALGTSLSFIDSISQDADGKITATKKTLDLANAHELNPFKGWYKTGDTLPTDGFDGAYLYFKDTAQTPAVTTIYQWNGTTYADTGTEVDESNVQTFGSGQQVNAVKIKDENGEEVTGPADVLSAAAGKKINDRFVSEPVDLHITGTLFTNDGFWRPDGTHNTTSTLYRTTDPIDVSAYDKLILSCRPYSIISPCVFLNENNGFVYAIPAPTEGLTNKVITIPKDLGAKYAVFSCTDSAQHYNDFAVYGVGIKTILTQDDIVFQSGQKLKDTSVAASLQSSDNYIPTVKAVNDALGDLPLYTEQVVDLQITASSFSNIGFWRPNGTHDTTNTSYRTTDKIDVSTYDKLILSCHSNPTISPCVFLNENDGCVFAVPATPDGLTNEDIIIPKNLGAKYVVFSSTNSSSYYSEFAVYGVIKIPIANFVGKDSCYLSVTGNDENDGLTIETPVKTFLRARQITTNTLYIMEGEYEMVLSEFDLGIFNNIIGIGNVVLNAKPFIKVAEGELVSGYTKVYSYMYGNKTISNNMDFIWQHNIPDSATAISDSERHPLQKGKLYRLPSTRLYRASSIQDIENSTDKLMFFNDNANKTLYFSKIDNSDLSVNPIVIHLDTSEWTIKSSVKNHVHIENLDIRYGRIVTEGLSGEFVNCSAGMCYSGGAWVLDNSSIKLYRCEGYAAYVPTGGDGFNTHTAGQIEMFDCWGHDNRDDGESAHENVIIIQHGGLYEYNGNGCTPAVGAKASYYNVICRNNANHDWVYSENPRVGFSNQSSDGGGGMICFNCVAENSEIGFRNTNANSPSCCYNCIAINCTVAFSNIRSISSQVQSDWTETDNTKPSFIKNKPS